MDWMTTRRAEHVVMWSFELLMFQIVIICIFLSFF